jgi:hypothetical protein
MRDPKIPDAVRRFVLTSVPSVPFLEAVQLFHSTPNVAHTSQAVAAALYLRPATGEKLIDELLHAGVVAQSGKGFLYAPRDPELSSALDALIHCYQTNLVGITNLVHDATQRSAEKFANAFKLKKES